MTDTKKHTIKNLKSINSCVILHNILLNTEKDPHPEQDTWLEETDVDDVDIICARENLSCSIGTGHKTDERCLQVHTYLEFKEYIA